MGSPGTLVSDGAQEYKSRGFNEVCQKNGYQQEYPAPYTPQEKGKIERGWSTTAFYGEVHARDGESAKATSPYALATSFYVKKRCFLSAHNCTQYEMFFGEKPNLSEMQPFGCRAFVLTEDRKKRDSNAQTGIFLGYSSRSKCFIVCTEDGTLERKPSKMWTSRNVTCNMDCFPGDVTSVAKDMTHDRCGETTIHYDNGLNDVKSSPDVEQEEVADETIPNTGHLGDEDDNTQQSDKVQGTFCGAGFTQTPGLVYHETYSPTVRLLTLRTVLACGVRQGIKFRQIDIKTAYLNAPIDEEIFQEQPEGFKQGDGDMVCKLKRSLYGLKQSGRNWYEYLSHQLEQLGFHSSQHDNCPWTQKRGDHHCWALVWVADIVYDSTDEDFERWFEAEVGKQFAIGDFGPLAWFLGIAFKAEQDVHIKKT